MSPGLIAPRRGVLGGEVEEGIGEEACISASEYMVAWTWMGIDGYGWSWTGTLGWHRLRGASDVALKFYHDIVRVYMYEHTCSRQQICCDMRVSMQPRICFQLQLRSNIEMPWRYECEADAGI